MLSPSNPPFDHDHQHRSPITMDSAEEFNCAVDPLMPLALAGRRRRADTTPRARRKKDHRYDAPTLARINSLGEDERHIMKDYAGNTAESRLETLSQLEEFRRQFGGPPIKAEGQLGPKKGKTKVEWICVQCGERKNTFQKIAGHITSHHWKLKVWTCQDSACGRKYCSLNELTRHTKETHRRKRPERSNTTRITVQSNLRSSAELDSTPPATYRSGSNYSDGLSPVPAPRQQPSHSLPSLVQPRSLGSRDSMQEPVSMHRYSTRSSKAAPYAAQDSKFAHLHNSSSAPRNVAQPRNQHKGPVYRNFSPAVERRAPPQSLGHNTYQDMPKAHYRPTSTEQLFNTATQPGTSPAHRSTNSTDGTASHVASGSYSEGDDAPLYATTQRNQFYDTFGSSPDRYRVVSDGPAARAGSHQDHHFQYTTQADMPSNQVKYHDAWQIGDESFSTGSRPASFSVGAGSLHNIPRQTSPLTYGPMEKGLYSMAPYPAVHGFDNQSVSGRLADEAFDPYIAYLDDPPYLPYGGDSNQVSRRWLP